MEEFTEKVWLRLSCKHSNQVLERAMRCGTEALAASKADAEWIASAGDAVDIADMLANRSASMQSSTSHGDKQWCLRIAIIMPYALGVRHLRIIPHNAAKTIVAAKK